MEVVSEGGIFTYFIFVFHRKVFKTFPKLDHLRAHLLQAHFSSMFTKRPILLLSLLSSL